MRNNNLGSPHYQPPQNFNNPFRNTIGHGQAPQINKLITQQQGSTINPPKPNTFNFQQLPKPTAFRNNDSKVINNQTKFKAYNPDSSLGFMPPKKLQQQSDNKNMGNLQQQSNQLRGSCPNVFKKFQQANLRSTTQFNPAKLNASFQPKKQEAIKQQPVYSFIKPSSPKNKTFHGTAVSINQVGKSNNSITTNPGSNESKNQVQSSNDLKQAQQKKYFSSLNDILLNKQCKKIQSGKKSKVIGGFQIGKNLGKGKFGQVFLARHKQTGFLVAVKRIVKAKVKQYKMLEQLKNQVKLHWALNHPNIVKLYGFFEEAEDVYLVLQYLNGGTLFDFMVQKQKCTVKQTADFLRDTISALQYLHDKSIAHRDIKPQNIVLSAEGVAKLCDFGWSALVESSRQTYCGTFDYAPPEILERKNYDSSVDIWCIGVLTYELLTGKVPFQGEVRNVVMDKIINVDKTKIDYPNYIPASAKQFIQKLVQKDPNLRPKCRQLLKFQFFIDYPPMQAKKKNNLLC